MSKFFRLVQSFRFYYLWFIIIPWKPTLAWADQDGSANPLHCARPGYPLKVAGAMTTMTMFGDGRLEMVLCRSVVLQGRRYLAVIATAWLPGLTMERTQAGEWQAVFHPWDGSQKLILDPAGKGLCLPASASPCRFERRVVGTGDPLDTDSTLEFFREGKLDPASTGALQFLHGPLLRPIF